MNKKKMKENENNQRTIMIVMAAISSVLIITGIAVGDAAVLGNIIIIAMFLTAGPYFFFKYSKYMWVKSLEIEFPYFIRDLADSVRSMPLPEALGVVKRSNYGNLSAEIVSMHNRMSWGTPFVRSLEIFQEKSKASKIISEALMIVKESYLSGGNMVYTLESVARDLLMLREAEQERSSMLRQHVMVMYAVFFMFLGISLMIIFVMVPMLESQSDIAGGVGGFQEQFVFRNPCPPGSAFIFPCGLYIGISTTLGIPPEKVGAYYISLFFFSLVIQGIFVGLITGQLGENSVTAGVKHSLIMVFITVTMFLFLSKAGLFPV
ncbi:MAG: type II secretion system F family protein [Candidatus Aenigmarchaeota archaeon]|nr:type II secretion system F family protein [Candidatus Aenigmarchaeota archaeon]